MEKLITCSLTQEPTSTPVICKKTGYIYDFQNIKKYLEKSDFKCPETKQQLNFPQDFQKIQALRGPALNIKSHASRNSKSIKIAENFYDILHQSQYDKKLIETLQNQLNASLKQQEASLRIIRKLQKQRDEARLGLVEYKNVQKLGYLAGEEEDLMQEETTIVQVHEEGQEQIQAIEYKPEEETGEIIDERFDEDAHRVQELIKNESFRLKSVRKELIKTQKQNGAFEYLEPNRTPPMALESIQDIDKLTQKQFTVGDSLFVQHPYDKSWVLVCSQ